MTTYTSDRTPLRWYDQLVDLALIQLSNWRWTWPSMVITGIVTPLIAVIGFGVLARRTGPDAVNYLFTGAIVVGLLFENQTKVASHFSYLRETGALPYFASLPIRRALLVVATVAAFLALSFPSLVVTAAAGALVLRAPLHPSPWLLIIVPLSVLPMAAGGALIGILTRSPAQCSSFSVVATVVMAGLGGVMLPPALLPSPVRVLGWINPATYAASAIRQGLVGPVTGRLAVDLAVLLCCSGCGFWVVGRKLRWRLS